MWGDLLITVVITVLGCFGIWALIMLFAYVVSLGEDAESDADDSDDDIGGWGGWNQE